MIPRIKDIKPLDNYILAVEFDDGKKILYDMSEDIDTLPGYDDLKNVQGLFKQVALDESRTCIFWNDNIDLPSDTIYEYGKVVLRPTAKYVTAKEDYILAIEFDNGEKKEFDVKPYIKGEWYGKLQDISYFNSVTVAGFTVVWPEGQDICPDELYEMSSRCS